MSSPHETLGLTSKEKIVASASTRLLRKRKMTSVPSIPQLYRSTEDQSDYQIKTDLVQKRSPEVIINPVGRPKLDLAQKTSDLNMYVAKVL